MKFVLWQQQLTRESVDGKWTLAFDREILIEGPSKEWCEAMHLHPIDIHPQLKVLSINVMPYDEWVKALETYSAVEQERLAWIARMNTTGFVNYPSTSPTPWTPYWNGERERAPAV